MMAAQLFLSSQSRLPDVLPAVPGGDKLQHGTWFFVLGLLAFRSGRLGEGWSRPVTAGLVLAGALLWGAGDELHQLFVPGRQAEVADLAADVAGTALAVALGEPLLRRLGRRRPAP
jgi:VanZ family protein